jgi:hypothetical protein
MKAGNSAMEGNPTNDGLLAKVGDSTANSDFAKKTTSP